MGVIIDAVARMTDARLCGNCGGPLKRRQKSECSASCQRAAQGKRNGVYSDEQREQCRKLRAEGLSTPLIAREMGITKIGARGLVDRLRCERPAHITYAKSANRPSLEQTEIVRREYTAGTNFAYIQAQVNAIDTYRLEGERQLAEWAKRLKVTRPKWWIAQRARERSGAGWATRRANTAKQAKPKTYAPSRAKGEGPPPPPVGIKPRTVPHYELIRIGHELGLREDAATSYERVSAEMRRADPAHPGFRPAATNYGWGESA